MRLWQACGPVDVAVTEVGRAAGSQDLVPRRSPDKRQALSAHVPERLCTPQCIWRVLCFATSRLFRRIDMMHTLHIRCMRILRRGPSNCLCVSLRGNKVTALSSRFYGRSRMQCSSRTNVQHSWKEALHSNNICQYHLLAPRRRGSFVCRRYPILTIAARRSFEATGPWDDRPYDKHGRHHRHHSV